MAMPVLRKAPEQARAFQGCAHAPVQGWQAESILIHTPPPIAEFSLPALY